MFQMSEFFQIPENLHKLYPNLNIWNAPKSKVLIESCPHVKDSDFDFSCSSSSELWSQVKDRPPGEKQQEESRKSCFCLLRTGSSICPCLLMDGMTPTCHQPAVFPDCPLELNLRREWGEQDWRVLASQRFWSTWSSSLMCVARCHWSVFCQIHN